MPIGLNMADRVADVAGRYVAFYRTVSACHPALGPFFCATIL